jgi:endonuclease YncB( thermonuclease family)
MRGNPRLLLPILILLLFAALPAHGWSGRVCGVADGDTISVLHEGRAVKIRLYGIDCPEKHQAFGQKAKTFTSQLTFGRLVEVNPVTRDRYGRIVAWVHVGGRCLNEEILRAGYAWHFKQFSRDRHLAGLEEKARAARAGLWGDPAPVAPWEFRKSRNGKRPNMQTASASH